jgi:hypothetical protein
LATDSEVFGRSLIVPSDTALLFTFLPERNDYAGSLLVSQCRSGQALTTVKVNVERGLRWGGQGEPMPGS